MGCWEDVIFFLTVVIVPIGCLLIWFLRQKTLTARHEAGHLIAVLVSSKLSVHRATAEGAEGWSYYLFDNSTASVWEVGVVCLAGMIAVGNFKRDHRSSDDLQDFRKMADKLMRRQSAGRDIRPPWSADDLTWPITDEGILAVCERRARELVRDHARQIKALTKALRRRGYLDRTETLAILAASKD